MRLAGSNRSVFAGLLVVAWAACAPPALAGWPARPDSALALSPPDRDVEVLDARADGLGGGWVAWDGRLPNSSTREGLFAFHFDADGEALGVTEDLARGVASATLIGIEGDGKGGLFAAVLTSADASGAVVVRRYGTDGGLSWSSAPVGVSAPVRPGRLLVSRTPAGSGCFVAW